MSIEIEGNIFTPFPSDQVAQLRSLSYHGRVKWLEYRFGTVFLEPFEGFLELENKCYIWLCVLSLATSAIESLAKFEYAGKDAFVKFVENFFPSGAFRDRSLRLTDPRPDRKTKSASTPAEHLYKFFRSSIAHDFFIDWGGLLHREDGAPSYLFIVAPETRIIENKPIPSGLGIAPRDFADDFKGGVREFFATLRSRNADSEPAKRFNQTFERIFLSR